MVKDTRWNVNTGEERDRENAMGKYIGNRGTNELNEEIDINHHIGDQECRRNENICKHKFREQKRSDEGRDCW